MSFSGPGGRTKKATVSANQTKGSLNASAEVLPVDAHHDFQFVLFPSGWFQAGICYVGSVDS